MYLEGYSGGHGPTTKNLHGLTITIKKVLKLMFSLLFMISFFVLYCFSTLEFIHFAYQ